jgi:hypothetical protein
MNTPLSGGGSISGDGEGFRIKSQLMESELMSLRSKIDELEQKLGAHPSMGSLSQSSNQPTSR